MIDRIDGADSNALSAQAIGILRLTQLIDAHNLEDILYVAFLEPAVDVIASLEACGYLESVAVPHPDPTARHTGATRKFTVTAAGAPLLCVSNSIDILTPDQAALLRAIAIACNESPHKTYCVNNDSLDSHVDYLMGLGLIAAFYRGTAPVEFITTDEGWHYLESRCFAFRDLATRSPQGPEPCQEIPKPETTHISLDDCAEPVGRSDATVGCSSGSDVTHISLVGERQPSGLMRVVGLLWLDERYHVIARYIPDSPIANTVLSYVHTEADAKAFNDRKTDIRLYFPCPVDAQDISTIHMLWYRYFFPSRDMLLNENGRVE